MNNMAMLAFSRRVLQRVPRFIHDLLHSCAQQAARVSMRVAALSGCLIAFALLGLFSTQANSALQAGGASSVTLADHAGPVGAADQNGAVIQLPQPLDESDVHEGTVGGTAPAAMSNGSGYTPSDNSQDDAFERPTWSLALALALALSLTVGIAVALVGAWLSRSAIRRVVGQQKQIADQWARQFEAAEARERNANVVAWDCAKAIVIPQPFNAPDATRFYVEASLPAVTNMLDSLSALNLSDASPRHSLQLTMIQYAIRTWSQTLSDLLDYSPLESRALVIDESVTNLRELVNGVVALWAPFATSVGLRIHTSVDPAVAEAILCDHARLGQLCFHLLARAIQLGVREEIVLMVRGESLDAGSQSILISLTEAGEKSALVTRRQRPDFSAGRSDAAGKSHHADTCLTLCRALAQRMQGGLSITSGLDAIARVSFNAPFAVVQKRPPSSATRGDTGTPYVRGGKPPPESVAATRLSRDSVTACYEPFDHRFLDSLSNEGLNLSVFLDGWRRAMDDDVARLGGLCRQSEPDHMRSVLHRLSGAVGLVGARSLMEALRRASASPLEQNTISIDSLIERAKRLVMQLEVRSAVPGSS